MKKNLLKLLTLVLALVMVVTVFAGCKKADEETDAPTQGSEETPTETQEQPADEYKPSAAQLLNGKEWGKDYTELYDEIGDKVTIDDVQEDPTTGLAYVEYEGKTYELGMDFLSMAMVYKTAVPENSQYETRGRRLRRLVEVLHDPLELSPPGDPPLQQRVLRCLQRKDQGR